MLQYLDSSKTLVSEVLRGTGSRDLLLDGLHRELASGDVLHNELVALGGVRGVATHGESLDHFEFGGVWVSVVCCLFGCLGFYEFLLFLCFFVKNCCMGWRQGGCGKKYSQKIFSNSVDHKKSQKITKNHKKSRKITKITKNHESEPFWAAVIVL